MNSGGSIDNKGIKNLSIIKQLVKSKNLDFTKAQPFKADFLTFGARKTFIHLQKTFIKAPIIKNLIYNIIFVLRLMF